jgi:hypothetical protein
MIIMLPEATASPAGRRSGTAIRRSCSSCSAPTSQPREDAGNGEPFTAERFALCRDGNRRHSFLNLFPQTLA